VTSEEPEIQPSVDFALLADAVQAAQGKLYVLGGGWDTLFVQSFPARHASLGIGVRVRVPWSWADQPVFIAVDLQDEDGARVLPSEPLTHGIRVARPEGFPEGTDIGLVRAFTFTNLVIPREGAYSFVISLNQVVTDRLRFTVRRRPST
jgi:hypothetical protein